MNITAYSYTGIYANVTMCLNIIQFYKPLEHSVFSTQYNLDANLHIVDMPDCFFLRVSFCTEIPLYYLWYSYSALRCIWLLPTQSPYNVITASDVTFHVAYPYLLYLFQFYRVYARFDVLTGLFVKIQGTV
jgi:hypothetical protein